jgi:integral membrane protein (TIGR01906 family)
MSTTAVSTGVSAGPDILAWLRTGLSVLFVVALPLLLISTDLRWLVTDRNLILTGFHDNDVALTPGLDEPQLERIADAFVAYFTAPPGPLQLQVTVGGRNRPLFNAREVAHMEDVQALIQAFFRIQVIAAVIVLARLLVALFAERSAAWLGRDLLCGAVLVVAIVVVVGGAAIIDFDDTWTLFHQIAFRNDLWELDPRTDYLIMLFPEPFWFTATLRLAIAMTLETLALAVVGFLAWRWAPR